MVKYQKIKNMDFFEEIEDFFVDSLEVNTRHYANNCWPSHFNFIVTKNGMVFQDKSLPLKNIRIWVECEADVDRREVLNSLFSSSVKANPSKGVVFKNSRSASYLMSKILRCSDFSNNYMRAKILEDESFDKVFNDYGFVFYRPSDF